MYKTIWNKTKDFKTIKLNALPPSDDRYIKIRRYGDNVYTNFRGLNMREDGAECKSFTIISIDSLLVDENKYYLQVYLDNCAYKIVNTEMVVILMVIFSGLINYSYKCCITIKSI